jgi:hypothetical protein
MIELRTIKSNDLCQFLNIDVNDEIKYSDQGPHSRCLAAYFIIVLNDDSYKEFKPSDQANIESWKDRLRIPLGSSQSNKDQLFDRFNKNIQILMLDNISTSQS